MLDVSFDGDGVVEAVVGTGSRATAIATTADGKVVAAGYAYTNSLTTNFALTRYNDNGSLDTTFGTGGSVNSQAGKAFGVAVQPDGKILVAGVSTTGQTGDDFTVIRYTSSGALDRSFGKNGLATIDIGSKSVDTARAMVLQPDGKIVVAGITRVASPNVHSVAVVRLTTSGALDTSFGTGGKVVRAPSTGYLGQFSPEDRKEGMALDPVTNRIIVAGSLGGLGTVVLRLNTNGTPDKTFDGDGEVILSSLISTVAVAVQGDQKIVVGGTHADLSGTTDGWGLVRLTANGTADAVFGNGGGVTTLEPTLTSVSDVAIQSDGQILLYGNQYLTDPVLVRYNGANGSLDTSFGTNGFATGTGMGPMYCTDMTLDTAGRIVIVGGSSSGQVTSIVARFLATGPTIGAFAASSSTVAAGDPMTLTASGVTARNPGSTVTQVAIYGDGNADGKLDASDTLLGYATQTAAGTWTLNLSTAGWAAGSYKLFARALDSLGALSDPVSIDLTVI